MNHDIYASDASKAAEVVFGCNSKQAYTPPRPWTPREWNLNMFFNIVLMWFVFRNNETFQKQCCTQKTWKMQCHNARCVNGNWLGDGPNGSIYSKSVIFNFQFVMHYVWSMFEFSCNKCPAWAFQMSKKRRKKAVQIKWLAFHARLKFKACMRFFLTKHDKTKVHFQWNDLPKEIAKTNTKRTIQSSIFDTCKLHEYKTVEVKLHMGQL